MPTDLQPAFRALADPTRRDILRLLGTADLTIAQVSEHFDITRAAVKKHLTVLSDGGLITVETRGRTRVNRLDAAGLAPVLNWLEYFDRFWGTALSNLKTALETPEKDTK